MFDAWAAFWFGMGTGILVPLVTSYILFNAALRRYDLEHPRKTKEGVTDEG